MVRFSKNSNVSITPINIIIFVDLIASQIMPKCNNINAIIISYKMLLFFVGLQAIGLSYDRIALIVRG